MGAELDRCNAADGARGRYRGGAHRTARVGARRGASGRGGARRNGCGPSAAGRVVLIVLTTVADHARRERNATIDMFLAPSLSCPAARRVRPGADRNSVSERAISVVKNVRCGVHARIV